ncbi:hypothetical protein PIB30_092662, partial [Stylosanthes scabra]|nr:hypothetical protein [Stylosanthes scabra]
VEKMKKMESENLASGASKAPRICVDITQKPTHMRGIYHQGHFQNLRSHACWVVMGHAYAWVAD